MTHSLIRGLSAPHAPGAGVGSYMSLKRRALAFRQLGLSSLTLRCPKGISGRSGALNALVTGCAGSIRTIFLPQAPGAGVPPAWLSSLMPALPLRQRCGALNALVTGCAGSIVMIALLLGTMAPARAEPVGCVSTTFKLVGPNDKICIDSFHDPKVDGVVCHVSRARTGGLSGMVGLAEDTSDASIACRQTGPITLKGRLDDGEDVFKESRSWLFKKLRVVRFYDKPNNTLVYLSYSDKLVDGSPKNAISTVPIMPWGGR